jgi:hypothetical protein
MNAKELRLSPEDLVREQKRQLAAKRSSRRRTAPRRKPGEEKKSASRRERTAEIARLREVAFAFTGGRCLACMGELPWNWHLHHLVSGGLRRHRESERNTVALCPACHHLAHRNDVGTLAALITWAATNGDDECRRTMARRIEKLQAPRPTEDAR